MSVKVMTLYNEGGPEIFSSNVDHLFNQARIFAQMIHKRRPFELAVEPQANILCFRYNDLDLDEEGNNLLNLSIRENILNEGEFYIVQTILRKKHYLRTTIMNPFTVEKDFETLLDKIETIAKSLKLKK